jgi:hypothetical protein
VLLPAPDERPALTSYQEAGQFLGGCLTGWWKRVFCGKAMRDDSKTGRVFCPKTMQNSFFARFLGSL